MTHTELFHTHLRHYGEKNLEAISAMLAEELHLRGWNLSIFGRLEVLRETAKTIEISILLSLKAQRWLWGTQIIVDEKIDLYVADVLTDL